MGTKQVGRGSGRKDRNWSLGVPCRAIYQLQCSTKGLHLGQPFKNITHPILLSICQDRKKISRNPINLFFCAKINLLKDPRRVPGHGRCSLNEPHSAPSTSLVAWTHPTWQRNSANSICQQQRCQK